MKKILIIFLVFSFCGISFSLDKRSFEKEKLDLYFFKDRKDLKNNFDKVLINEGVKFSKDRIDLQENYSSLEFMISLSKEDPLYKIFNDNNYSLAISIKYQEVFDKQNVKIRDLIIGLFTFNSGNLYKSIKSFQDADLIDARNKSPNFFEVPTQNIVKELRKTNKNIVSFMSFYADTSIADVEKYLEKYNFDYSVIDGWTSGGTLDSQTYIIEDISYLGITFNRIEIKFYAKNILRKTNIIDSITCYPLTDNDFDKFEKYLRANYGYSIKEKLYYGQSRFYSNGVYYIDNRNYEGESSGKIFYDEISCDSTQLEVVYKFTVEHKK